MALHSAARAATVLRHVLPNRQCDQRDRRFSSVKPPAVAVANCQLPAIFPCRQPINDRQCYHRLWFGTKKLSHLTVVGWGGE